MKQLLSFMTALLMSASLTERAIASTDSRAVELSLTPPGLSGFCDQYPEQCPKTQDMRTSVSLEEVFDIVPTIQRAVNVRIAYEEDDRSWQPGATIGNCVTYALEKRWQLLERGFPPSALRLAYTRGRRANHMPFWHLILVVIVEDGEDLILDNRKYYPVFKNQTRYNWIAIQSPDHPERWMRLRHTSSKNVVF